MSELEENIEQILFSNDSGVIAGALVDLLLLVKELGVIDEVLTLLYPRLDHCRSSQMQYIAGREQAISSGIRPTV